MIPSTIESQFRQNIRPVLASAWLNLIYLGRLELSESCNIPDPKTQCGGRVSTVCASSCFKSSYSIQLKDIIVESGQFTEEFRLNKAI